MHWVWVWKYLYFMGIEFSVWKLVHHVLFIAYLPASIWLFNCWDKIFTWGKKDWVALFSNCVSQLRHINIQRNNYFLLKNRFCVHNWSLCEDMGHWNGLSWMAELLQ